MLQKIEAAKVEAARAEAAKAAQSQNTVDEEKPLGQEQHLRFSATTRRDTMGSHVTFDEHRASSGLGMTSAETGEHQAKA